MLNFKLFLFLLEDKNDVMIFLSVSIQGFFIGVKINDFLSADY
jgi:hypothetical protein